MVGSHLDIHSTNDGLREWGGTGAGGEREKEGERGSERWKRGRRRGRERGGEGDREI